MYISMQGPWTIHVQSTEDNTSRQYIVSGTNGNANGTNYDGVHPALSASPDVFVNVAPDTLWTIDIQANQGAGFQSSDTEISFPVKTGNKYHFDIKSNDRGTSTNDPVLDDLILRCSMPVTAAGSPVGYPDEFLVYGTVSTYNDACFNPCYNGWLVIETQAALNQALLNPAIKQVVQLLYPERIGLVNPNPPDPGPFTPIMINLQDSSAQVARMGTLYSKLVSEIPASNDAKKKFAKDGSTPVSNNSMTELRFEKNIVTNPAGSRMLYQYDNISIAKALNQLPCWEVASSPAPFLAVRFSDYDRSPSELAGGPYTGTGPKFPLGAIVTDQKGNYILRFTQSVVDLLVEAFDNTAAGEDYHVQWRPDIIASVNNTNPSTQVLYESAPYYNIPNLFHLNLCIPDSQIPAKGIICTDGNLIGSLGDVFIGGNQNTSTDISTMISGVSALDRNGDNNHLRPDGRITVHSSLAGFSVDCACWAGMIDVRGCMNNPNVAYYSIRYSKDGNSWQYVNETYLHPKYQNEGLPNYNGDLVGPFTHTINNGGSIPNVPLYQNIQLVLTNSSLGWEFSQIDRYMQLHTNIYQGSAPGTVYFIVECYDASLNFIPGFSDMIALYIDNNPLGFSLNDVSFVADGVNIVEAECNLYRMSEAYLNAPLNVTFQANDKWGFMDSYNLSFSKCNTPGFTPIVNYPVSPASANPAILSGSNPFNSDGNGCPGYHGTGEMNRFGDYNPHQISFIPPSMPNGKWLTATESYTVLSVYLTANKRETNGYNTGITGTYQASGSVAVERLP